MRKEKIRHFNTGARRGSGGKFDFLEYMSPLAFARFAEHMRKSAAKYGTGNWRKGIPVEEAKKSLRRHVWMIDMEDYGIELEPGTDHLASVIFNAMIAMHEEEIEKIKKAKEIYGYEIGRVDQKKLRNGS